MSAEHEGMGPGAAPGVHALDNSSRSASPPIAAVTPKAAPKAAPTARRVVASASAPLATPAPTPTSGPPSRLRLPGMWRRRRSHSAPPNVARPSAIPARFRTRARTRARKASPISEAGEEPDSDGSPVSSAHGDAASESTGPKWRRTSSSGLVALLGSVRRLGAKTIRRPGFFRGSDPGRRESDGPVGCPGLLLGMQEAVLLRVLSHCSLGDLRALPRVCKVLRHVASGDAVWQARCTATWPEGLSAVRFPAATPWRLRFRAHAIAHRQAAESAFDMDVPRDAAEVAVCSGNSQPGDFLIRYSKSQRRYVLTIRTAAAGRPIAKVAAACKHLLLEHTTLADHCILVRCEEDDKWRSPADFIADFRAVPLNGSLALRLARGTQVDYRPIERELVTEVPGLPLSCVLLVRDGTGHLRDFSCDRALEAWAFDQIRVHRRPWRSTASSAGRSRRASPSGAWPSLAYLPGSESPANGRTGKRPARRSSSRAAVSLPASCALGPGLGGF